MEYIESGLNWICVKNMQSNSWGRDDLQCQTEVGKRMESVVRNVKSNEQQNEKGKGKLASMDRELHGSEEEFLGADLTTYIPENSRDLMWPREDCLYCWLKN